MTIRDKLGIPQTVQLLAVTKYATPEQVSILYAHGIRDMAENTVQKLLAKQAMFPDVRWHLIGPLQRNKVAKAVAHAACIQSVDRLVIADAIATAAQKRDLCMPVMIQVNMTNHPDRAGFPVSSLEAVLDQLTHLSGILVTGLMIMGPHPATDDAIRSVFLEAQALFDTYQALYPSIQTLSMGMSHDYKLAIHCGSTQVRLGSVLLDLADTLG